MQPLRLKKALLEIQMPICSTAAHLLANRTIHRAVLDNGATVLAIENPAADIIAARIFIKAGGRCEQPHQAGISHLLTAVLPKGSDRLSAQAIAEQVESVGASLGVDAAADYCLLSLKSVSSDFDELLALSAHLLRSPSFPTHEVELEQRLTLQGLRSMQEQPFSIAHQQLRQAMYQTHPYALAGLGTEETIASFTSADLQHYHQTYFRPDNLVISIVGRLRPEAAIALVDARFGDWQNPHLALPDLHLPSIAPDPQATITAQDTQQAIVMLGHLAASVQQADYMPLKLLNTYLGNGLSSRLFVELREKRGLAYEVSAFYPTRLDQSQFVVYMGTSPENAAIAREGLAQEIDRLTTVALTPEELQSAKNKLLGQYALSKQTNAQIAQIFGWYETLGLGIEFDWFFQEQIAAVTIESAQLTAQRFFSSEPYLSLVGPEVAIQTAIAA